MKKYILAGLFSVFSFLSVLPTFAQLGDSGFWVVESNHKTPFKSTVYFYNNDQVLIYKEQINGIKLKINRKKTIRKLNKALEQSLAAWQRNHQVTANQQILARLVFK